MAIVTHYICDRCGADCEAKPGTFALFDIAFYTGKQEEGKPVIKRVQECKRCFDIVLGVALGAAPL